MKRESRVSQRGRQSVRSERSAREAQKREAFNDMERPLITRQLIGFEMGIIPRPAGQELHHQGSDLTSRIMELTRTITKHEQLQKQNDAYCWRFSVGENDGKRCSLHSEDQFKPGAADDFKPGAADDFKPGAADNTATAARRESATGKASGEVTSRGENGDATKNQVPTGDATKRRLKDKASAQKMPMQEVAPQKEAIAVKGWGSASQKEANLDDQKDKLNFGSEVAKPQDDNSISPSPPVTTDMLSDFEPAQEPAPDEAQAPKTKKTWRKKAASGKK